MLKDMASKEICSWKTIGAPLDSCTLVLNPVQSTGGHWGMVTRVCKPRGEPVELAPGTAGWVGDFSASEGESTKQWLSLGRTVALCQQMGKGPIHIRAWDSMICHLKGLFALLLIVLKTIKKVETYVRSCRGQPANRQHIPQGRSSQPSDSGNLLIPCVFSIRGILSQLTRA